MPSAHTVAQFYSAFFALGNLCLGLINGILGPTLLDLAEIYRIDTNQASQVYTSRSVGILFGAALESFAVSDRNSENFLTASLLVEGVSIALFPVAGYFWLTHAASLLNGVAGVLFECGSYVILANLWEKPTLQLQIYQLAYGFSTFVIPFACEPFLSKRGPIGDANLPHDGESRVFIPYAVVGGCCIVLAGCMILFSRCTSSPPLRKHAENTCPGSTEGEIRKGRFDIFEILLVSLMSILLMFSFSAESIFTGMISPFVVQSELNMTKSDGAFLGGVFRATFFAGRILTVIAYKLSLSLIMGWSLAFLLLSSIALSLFVMTSPLVIWLTTAGLGLGLSSLFGTTIAWTCQYIPLKHWHMAVTMLAVCVGTSSPAFSAAPWIDTHPMILPYVILGVSVMLCLNFGAMLILVKGRNKMTAQ